MSALRSGFGIVSGCAESDAVNKMVARLRQWLQEADYAVAFTGAGVSTDSGLSDFRSPNGIYRQENSYGVPAEKILTPAFYESHPLEFFTFYRTKLLDLSARSNYIHFAMADMEKKGLLKCVITQNADNLHQEAGSVQVIDFHGNVHVNICSQCGTHFPAAAVANSNGVPRCSCGGIIRPGILLFGEIPDMTKIMALVKELNRADLVLVAGSSLQVSSAHRLLSRYKGRLVIWNLESTPYDRQADLVIHEPLLPLFQTLWPLE